MTEANLWWTKVETAEKTPAARRTETAEKISEDGAEGTAGEVLAAVCQWRARETPGTPPAPRDAAEGQEAVHQNSGHALDPRRGKVTDSPELHKENGTPLNHRRITKTSKSLVLRPEKGKKEKKQRRLRRRERPRRRN
ncbi:hypothetical protein NDU88_008556 [Pleurodeles waltl]|uniref:Uncharacterized protein n=1 Tax=Pleurodeles waltl TaxID=8319 RepID=A0AAV7NYA8_PLEWA|nr:hypothetical protein NDU88_008556 [Pleurodeles waltl]